MGSDYGQVENSRPILISGTYRSGTTFLSALLGAHPLVRSSSSTVKFLRFCLGKYGSMAIQQNREQLINQSNERIKKRWGLSLDVKKILAHASAYQNPSYALLYDLIMKDLLFNASVDPSLRWVEKLAVQWQSIPDFCEMFPHGKVIHVVRDPRDVMASYKHMTFEPGNTFLDAAFNCRNSMEYVYHLDAQYKPQVLVVTAEAFAFSKEKTLKRVFDFLEIPLHSDVLDEKKFNNKGEEWSTNTSYGKGITGWPDGKPRWNTKLTRVEILIAELITQPYLTMYGYKHSGMIPSREDWIQIYDSFNDNFLKERLKYFLQTGLGTQGYRTDPYQHEMQLVFGNKGREEWERPETHNE